MRAALCAALILLAAPGAAAAAAGQAAEADGQRRERALALAKLVQPEEQAIVEAMKMLDRTMAAAPRDNPQFKEIEAEIPGFTAAYWEAAKPDVRQMLAKRLPGLWNLLADIYAAELTVAQIGELEKFFSAPTGRKLIAHMQSGIDPAPMLRDVTGEEGEITAKGYDESLKGALATLADKMNREDFVALAAFNRSSAGRAFLRIGPKVRKAGLDWMNAPNPEDDARMEEIAMRTVAKLLEKRGGD